MNCFNIRELQGILKRKYFPDLINNSDHHLLMESSMLGLRFKINSNDSIRPEQSLFYNFGITNLPKYKTSNLISYTDNASYLPKTNMYYSTYITELFNTYFKNYFSLSPNIDNKFTFFFESYLFHLLIELVGLIKISILTTISSLPSLFFSIQSIVIQNLNTVSASNLLKITNYNTPYTTKNLGYMFSSENIIVQSDKLNKINLFSDMSNSVRYNKFNNILIGYDYKSGHYLSI
jgi:hypothetical protein